MARSKWSVVSAGNKEFSRRSAAASRKSAWITSPENRTPHLRHSCAQAVTAWSRGSENLVSISYAVTEICVGRLVRQHSSATAAVNSDPTPAPASKIQIVSACDSTIEAIMPATGMGEKNWPNSAFLFGVMSFPAAIRRFSTVAVARGKGCILHVAATGIIRAPKACFTGKRRISHLCTCAHYTCRKCFGQIILTILASQLAQLSYGR